MHRDTNLVEALRQGGEVCQGQGTRKYRDGPYLIRAANSAAGWRRSCNVGHRPRLGFCHYGRCAGSAWPRHPQHRSWPRCILAGNRKSEIGIQKVGKFAIMNSWILTNVGCSPEERGNTDWGHSVIKAWMPLAPAVSGLLPLVRSWSQHRVVWNTFTFYVLLQLKYSYNQVAFMCGWVYICIICIYYMWGLIG